VREEDALAVRGANQLGRILVEEVEGRVRRAVRVHRWADRLPVLGKEAAEEAVDPVRGVRAAADVRVTAIERFFARDGRERRPRVDELTEREELLVIVARMQ